MQTNDTYMQRALDLANLAWGDTSPNPMVGAVIVKNGRIIGEGYHLYAGADHAEVMALKQSTEDVRGSELYVTLEPCCHQGRTPPCSQAVIQAGIKKVYIAIQDSNPKVAGQGIHQLRAAGIDVEVGLLSKPAEILNEGFLHFHRTGKPFVILKVGQTLDGKIATATGESKWITGPESRQRVQHIRAGVDAILAGSETILKDNPELIVHSERKYHHQPIRIILDTRGRLTPEYTVFQKTDTAPQTYWVIGPNVPFAKIKEMENRGVVVIPTGTLNGHIDLTKLMDTLGQMHIQSILVEGGAGIHGAFMDAGLVHKAVFFIAPVIMGGTAALSSIGGTGVPNLKSIYSLEHIHTESLGKDVMMEGYLKNGAGI